MYEKKVGPFCLIAAAGALAAGATDRLTVADRDPRPATVLGCRYVMPGEGGAPDRFVATVAVDGGGDVTAEADRDAVRSARRGDPVTVVTRRGAFGLSEELRVVPRR